MGPVGAGLGQQGGQEGGGEGEEGGLHLHLPPLPGEEGAGGGLQGDGPQVTLQARHHPATAGLDPATVCLVEATANQNRK